MIGEVVDRLACPVCRLGLRLTADALICAAGHAFDLGRSGYVSLLGPGARTDTGDHPDMVQARERWLGAGHYGPIAAAVCELAHRTEPRAVIDIGAGPGYYLATVLAASPTAVGVALDSSRAAARRSARLARVGSVVADAWARLPVRDGAADLAVSVFAPRSAAEIDRVLAPAGAFVAVTPEPAHLAEIREPLAQLAVDAGKLERLTAALAPEFRRAEHRLVQYRLAVDRDDLLALVRMGPSGKTRSAADLAAAVAALAQIPTLTVAVTVSRFVRA